MWIHVRRIDVRRQSAYAVSRRCALFPFPAQLLAVLLTAILFGTAGCVGAEGGYGADTKGGDGGRTDGAPSGAMEGRPCVGDSDCQTDTPCSVGFCEAGMCRPHPGPNGFICDDFDLCTLHDACFQGACLGVPMQCSDGNACTLDACDPKSGCVHAPTNQSCSDGDPCTAYKCADGSCSAAQSACDDGNPCTQESCSGTTGCHTVALSGPACNDGNPCTEGDTCTFGACKGGGECDDDNVCTVDSCGGAGGCVHVNLQIACSDGKLCTHFDKCDGGVCKGASNACDDGNPCTIDTCDAKTGACKNAGIADGGDCEDGNPCTLATTCQKGVCSGSQKNCADTDMCTDDKCVFPSGQCLHAPILGCKKN